MGQPVTRSVLAMVPLWLIAALLVQWPILREFGRSVWGGVDGMFLLWAHSWVYHALTTAPRSLFGGNIYYPARDTLALSEHMLADQLLFAPARALSGSAVIGFNVVTTAQFVLAAICAMLLAHRLYGSWRASIVAGTLFAFSPARLNALGHLHLLVSFWTPLALYFLDRFLSSRRWRDCLRFSLCLTLQFWASHYLGYFLAIACAVWITAHAMMRPRAVLRIELLARGAGGLAVSAALVLPLTLPYLRVRSEYGALLPSREFLAEGSVSLVYLPYYLWPAWGNILFPGLLCLALALVSLGAALRHPDPSRSRVWMVWGLTGTAVVLSMGPDIRLRGSLLPSPYLLLWHWVPGFASLRLPARFGILATLGFSLAAAAGYRWLDEHIAGRRGRGLIVLGVAVAFAIAEAVVTVHIFPPARTGPLPTPHEVRAEYRWLADRGEGAVLELPHLESPDRDENRQREVDAMYSSTYHWRPLVNGYSGYVPAPALDVEERVRGFPTSESVRYLQAIGVRHVLVHPASRLHGRLGPVLKAADAAVREFPSGSRLFTLPAIATASDVGIRVLAPTHLPAGGRGDLGVLFVNEGASYWVNRGQRACSLSTKWATPAGQPLTAARTAVLPPVALAPGEMRDRRVAVEIPDANGSVRLRASVECDRAPGQPRWRANVGISLLSTMSTAENETEGLGARYLGWYLPRETCAGCGLLVRFHAKNTGTVKWLRAGRVRLGFNWVAADGRALLGGRLHLERDVYPGQEIVVGGTLPSPPAPGRYELVLDLLQEGHISFRNLGLTAARVPVTVE